MLAGIIRLVTIEWAYLLAYLQAGDCPLPDSRGSLGGLLALFA